jgi:hypothetical protein
MYCQSKENLKSVCRIDYFDSLGTIISAIAMVASKVGNAKATKKWRLMGI